MTDPASEFSHFDGKLLCRTLGIRVPDDDRWDAGCWTLSAEGVPCQPLSVGEIVEYVAGRMLDPETYQSVLAARVFNDKEVI